MKLTYHQGRNFGDALNPIIFRALFPDFFDDDDGVIFVGIGSLFGLKKGTRETKKRIYFSTGFADGAAGTYGTLPRLTTSDDVICVRGPLTARILSLPPEKAIADGAILLPHLFGTAPQRTEHEFAFMPHAGSFDFYDGWQSILTQNGIELIDPRDDPWKVVERIQRTGTLFAEAMHGAILADAIGIPWVPVVAYPTINSFKWQDFAASMEIDYTPSILPSIFDRTFIRTAIRSKLTRVGLAFLDAPAAQLYFGFQRTWKVDKVNKGLKELKQREPILSSRKIVSLRTEAILEKADQVRRKYG